MSDLTIKQQVFINEYLKCYNATEAARRAGYKGNDVTLASVGYENLRKPHISEAISQHLQESAMSKDEVLMRLGQQARGSIEDFLDFYDGLKTPILNLAKAKELGVLHLIKKMKYNTQGGLEIELYDAKAALELIGRNHKMFTDKVEHSGSDGEAIPVKVISGVKMDDI